MQPPDFEELFGEEDDLDYTPSASALDEALRYVSPEDLRRYAGHLVAVCPNGRGILAAEHTPVELSESVIRCCGPDCPYILARVPDRV